MGCMTHGLTRKFPERLRAAVNNRYYYFYLWILSLTAVAQTDADNCSLEGRYHCEEYSVTAIASGEVQSYGKGSFDVDIKYGKWGEQNQVSVYYDDHSPWIFQNQHGKFLETSEVACVDDLVRARQGTNRIFVLKFDNDRPSYEFELFQRYPINHMHSEMTISYGRCDRRSPLNDGSAR